MLLTPPCTSKHSTMIRSVENNGSMSLEDTRGSNHSPTRKLSLLIDYSKKRADITATPSAATDASTAQRSRLFGSLGQESAGSTDAIIDSALATLAGEEDSPEQDKGNTHDVSAAPISFRLRKSSMGRCKSFDERKLTTYENLQNSLRHLMQEESDHPHSESSTSDDDPMMSCSMPAATVSSPGGNRRLQLARIKHRNQNHQSMRHLTTSSGSTRQLMKSLGGESEHGNGSATATTQSPVKSPMRRPTIRGEKGSLRSASSRNLRRSRTMPNKPGMPSIMKNSLSNSTYHGQSISFKLTKPKDSLSSASEHSYLKHPISVSKASKLSARRTSLMAMSESMPATNGTSCRRATVSRNHSKGSRRDLLADCSAPSNHDSFNNLDVDASHFVTGSRIRRHGSIPKLVIAD